MKITASLATSFNIQSRLTCEPFQVFCVTPLKLSPSEHRHAWLAVGNIFRMCWVI